ncbi:MAG: sigma-70 family RNA polymerase sigma factor [Planctomycetaceae bacterium]
METPVADLVDRMRRGELPALGEYVERHKPQLLAYINRRLGPALRTKIEPDDIVQEASVVAVQRSGDLQGNDRDPFGWLCQIAEQRLIDAHRRLFVTQKRSADREVALSSAGNDTRQSPLIDFLVASFTTPSQAFSRDQNELLLREALAALPTECQEVLRLRYVAGMASKEIAAQIHKSDAAVRVLLSRSLAKLQGIFDGSPPR